MKFYKYLDHNINDCLNADIDFSCLISSGMHKMKSDDIDLFFSRYSLIKEYQKICLDLFKASLSRDFDPELAELVLNELPAGQGWNFHNNLTTDKLQTPVFFRTDEVIPGKISEIQCPGSAWGLYEQIYQFVEEFKKDFGTCSTFSTGLAHNFIRAHAFAGLLSDNHFKRRIKEYDRGELFYDLPPSILFDEKIPLIFPFWEKTGSYFSDAVREIFPYTQLIRPEGFTLEDGTNITLEDFIDLPRSQRNYYIKYAGSELALNWGSKGVYYAATLSMPQRKQLIKKLIKDFTLKKYWIIQKGYSQKEQVSFITRDNKKEKTRAYSKFSGFYGPQGLMGILVMQRSFNKVHGSDDTIVSIVQ